MSNNLRFAYKGYTCIIYQADINGRPWVGIVELPVGHPLWGTTDEHPPVESDHGISIGYEYVKEDGTAVWLLGFDCGHSLDLADGWTLDNKIYKVKLSEAAAELERLVDDIIAYCDGSYF